MEYWYFLFEGVVRTNTGTDRPGGVYSSAMAPGLNKRKAEENLINALDAEGIDLVAITDRFRYDAHEVDESDPENRPWICWHEEVVRTKQVVFTPWQLFDLEE